MNASEPAHVTIVTPVYNGDAYLAECIESVLRQTYTHWDYVIVNNRSTDRSLEIAESYAARDPRIRVVTNPEFVGVIRNHNLACQQLAAESRYCKVLQADDWLYPECLADMIALADANPNVGMVGSFVLHGDHVRCDGLPVWRTVVPGKEICRLNLLDKVYTFLAPTALLLRADIVRARHEYFNEAHLHSDVEACYEVLREADFGFVHKVLSFVRRQEESVTASHSKRFNLLTLANLELLVQFGPIYLGEEELRHALRSRLDRYYDSLFHALYRSSDRRRIWREHSQRMAAIGRPLSGVALLRGALRNMFTRFARK